MVAIYVPGPQKRDAVIVAYRECLGEAGQNRSLNVEDRII